MLKLPIFLIFLIIHILNCQRIDNRIWYQKLKTNFLNVTLRLEEYLVSHLYKIQNYLIKYFR
jgi:hypothetical protein